MNARSQLDRYLSALQEDRPRWNSYVEILRHHALDRGQALGLVELPNLRDARRSFTYADMDRRCRAIAARLQTLGAQGARALLAFDNDADYLLTFLACCYAGVVAVPLFAPTQRNHLQRFKTVAADCDASLLLTSCAADERNPRFGLTREDFPQLQWVLTDAIPDSLADEWRPFAPEAQALAYLQYTSGSTGTPRGVMVTHANLMYQAHYNSACCDVRPGDRVLSWLPLFHDLGLIVGALQSVYNGMPLWLSTPAAVIMHPHRWLQAISDLRITHSGGPNFIYDLCTSTIGLDKLKDVDLSCWSNAFNTAEPIRHATIERFLNKFAPLGLHPAATAPGYGLAEATLTVCVKRRDAPLATREVDSEMLTRDIVVDVSADRPSHILVGCGQAAEDTEVSIVDPVTSRPCPIGSIGEVWVSGPTVARGYWNKPDETRKTFHARLEGSPHAWLRTGDLGFLDADDQLYITGRLKDLIIVAGRNHYPQDIEETVEQIGKGIRNRGVVALSAPGSEGDAVVILAEIQHKVHEAFDTKSTATAICRAISSRHDLPVAEVLFLEPGQLPMTTSGKIQRRSCLGMLRDGQFQLIDRVNA